MDNSILDFMLHYWTEEEVKWYSEIFDLISSVNQDYTDNISIYLLSVEDKEINDITLDIKLMTNGILIELLKNIGVIVKEDIDTNSNILLYTIYKELINIENNEQIDTMISILESGDEAKDIVYELLTTVGGLYIDESDYHSVISKVLDFTISKLLKYLSSKKLSMVETNKTEFDTIRATKKIRNFIKILNDDNFHVINLVRQGYSLGLNLKTYLNLIWEDISQLDLKELIYNLYLLTIISNDVDNPVKSVENILGNYIVDDHLRDLTIRKLSELQLKIGSRLDD